MKTLKSVTSRVMVTLLVLLSLMAAPLWSQNESSVLAKTNRSVQKLSDDLVDKIAKNPGGFVSVILQMPAAATSGLLSEIGMSNGLIHRAYRNINAMSVRLPAAQVAKLAARLDVDFISLDRPVELMSQGHLETTTGATQARSQGTLMTG